MTRATVSEIERADFSFQFVYSVPSFKEDHSDCAKLWIFVFIIKQMEANMTRNGVRKMIIRFHDDEISFHRTEVHCQRQDAGDDSEMTDC